MGNKIFQKKKFDHTRDDIVRNENKRAKYHENKQQRANIEGTSGYNVNRDLHNLNVDNEIQ